MLQQLFLITFFCLLSYGFLIKFSSFCTIFQFIFSFFSLLVLVTKKYCIFHRFFLGKSYTPGADLGGLGWRERGPKFWTAQTNKPRHFVLVGVGELLLNATIKKKEFKKTYTHTLTHRVGSAAGSAKTWAHVHPNPMETRARTHTGLHSSKWCPFPVGSFSDSRSHAEGGLAIFHHIFLFLHLYTYITFLPLDVYNIYNWIFCFVLFVCCLLFTSFVLSISLKSYTCVHSLLMFCVYVFSWFSLCLQVCRLYLLLLNKISSFKKPIAMIFCRLFVYSLSLSLRSLSCNINIRVLSTKSQFFA